MDGGCIKMQKCGVDLLKKVMFISFILILVSAGSVVTDVNSCGTISMSDVYELTSDLSNSSTCITIESRNVTFDGNDTSGAYGVHVYNSTTTPANAMRNVPVTKWGRGVYYHGVKNGGIENNNVAGNATWKYDLLTDKVQSTVMKHLEIESDSPYKILLKSRQFVPARGLDPNLEPRLSAMAKARVQRAHVLIQFDHIPNNTEKKTLEKKGVKLLSYVPNKAWIASIAGDNLEELTTLTYVRWVGVVSPGDKITPHILEKGIDPWAINEDGTVNLTVLFHKDVSLEQASRIVSRHGAVINGNSTLLNALIVTVKNETILKLANEDEVQWIEEQTPPPIKFNDGARTAVGVDIVQAPPYNLNGTGIVVGEWDGGWVDNTTHDDLAGRVTIGDTGSSTDVHATHVAGTVMGNGTLSSSQGGTPLQWRGMTTNATLISYEWWNDLAELESEYDAAINTYGIDLSTNSWGIDPYCSGNLGLYNSETQALDDVVRGSLGRPISILWAAGNERSTNFGYCGYYGFTYGTVPPFGTAKNVITVGATNSNDDSMTSFSSWGPTDDGRIKPEVVAPGCQVGGDEGIKSTFPGDTYGVYCGTSMATPATAGSAALLIQNYRNTHSNADPLPSTVKAILINTAEDLGDTGPDYGYGYGRINVTAAIDLIRSDNIEYKVILEDNITQGEKAVYEFSVLPEQPELKVTLVWDDYPGTPSAAKSLVNDLNLVVIGPETTYYPWVLDPSNPSNPATTGVDDTNNVEQVVISSPVGGIYRLTVSGSSVPYGPQNFSLVISSEPLGVSRKGIITLDNAKYSCSSTVGVALVDTDLNVDNTTGDNANVNMTSTIEIAPEIITLTETGLNTSIFTGSINLSITDSSGVLQVAHGDVINATYYDADNGTGDSSYSIDTAIIDCIAPSITIFSPQNTTYTLSSVALSYSVNEPTFWVGYSLDGGANVTLSGNTTLTNLSNDQHKLTVYASDTVGNIGSSAVYFTVKAPDIWVSSTEINLTIHQAMTNEVLTIGNDGEGSLEFNLTRYGSFKLLPTVITDPEGDDDLCELCMIDIIRVDAASSDSEVTIRVVFDHLSYDITKGYISLDTDQDNTTGFPPSYGNGLPGQDIGAEFEISLWNMADTGNAVVINRTTNESIAEVPVIFGAKDLTISIPLSVLDNDDGGMDITTVLGSWYEPTDWAPDNGHGTIGPRVDWLSVAPTNGTVDVGDQTNIIITINATDLTAGTYNANIRIDSTDLDETPFFVPVNINLPNEFVPPTVTIDSPINTTYKTSSVDLNYSVADESVIDWVGYSLDGQANVTTRGVTTNFSNSAGGDLGTVTDITFDQAGSNTSLYLKIPKNATVSSATMEVGAYYEDYTTIKLQEADTENLNDAQVYVGSPNNNAGNSPSLSLWGWDNGRGYLMFNISNLPGDNTVVDAKLYLYAGYLTICDECNYSIYHVYNHSWDEGTCAGCDASGQSASQNITWNNQPCGTNFDDSNNCNLMAEDITEILWTPYYDWYSWSITEMAEKERESGDKNVSMVLRNADNGATTYFNAKEHASTSLRPYLNITHTDDPIATNLSIDTANDGITDWSKTGKLSSKKLIANLNITAISDYLDTCTPDEEGNCLIPLDISSDSAGTVQLDALVQYHYGPDATLTSLSNGSHNVTVYANDTVGNMNSNTVYFTVDTTPPTIIIDSPSNTTYPTTSVDLNYYLVADEDGIDWVGYSLDGQGNVTTSEETNSFSDLDGGDLGAATNITFDQAGSNTSVYLKIPKNATVYSVAMGVNGGNEITIQLQDPDTENLDDAQVTDAFPDNNYGTLSIFQAYDSDVPDMTLRSYIKFNISSIIIPSGKEIIDARLFLYDAALEEPGYPVYIYHVTYHDWNESTVTWNNQPCGTNFDDSTYCNLTSEDSALTGVGIWLNWLVIEMVKDEYGSGGKNVSMALRVIDNGRMGASSKENTDTSKRPYLNITHADVLIATNLSIDTANDSIIDWSMTGKLNSTIPPVDLNITAISDYLDTCTADEEGNCLVPLNISSDSAGTVQLDALSVKYYSSATLTSLFGGGHDVMVYANDTAGNMNSSTVYFSVDTTLPTITIFSPPNDTITDTTPDLNLTIDELVDITYSWDNGDNISGCQNCTSYNTTYGESVPDADTALLMHFNENDGSTAYDDSSNKNGTIYGATWTSGKFGNALDFGGNDYVEVPDDPSLDFGSDNFTIMAWIKTGSTKGFITNKLGGYDGRGSHTGVNGKGKFSAMIHDTGGDFGIAGTTEVNDSRWHHVAFVVNWSAFPAGTAYIYVDGSQETSKPITGISESLENNVPMVIGSALPWFTTYNFTGTIDEVHIIRRALDTTEIAEHYNKTLSDDQHNVTVYANDIAGDENSTTRYFTVGFPPQITITSPQNTTITDTTPDLNLTTDELADITYSWDNGDNISGCQNCTSYNTTYGESVPDADTALLMHFNENDGSTAYDDSSNKNGTIYGATWTSGKFGNALDFGGNDYVEVPDDPSLDFGSDNFTIMAWIKTGSTKGFITNKLGDYDGRGSHTGVNGKGKFSAMIHDTGGDFGIAGTTQVNDSRWHHVAFVVNWSAFPAGTAYIYVDGSQETSKPITGISESLENNVPMVIGSALPWLTTYNFTGTIDEVHIIRRALNANEIADYHNKTLPESSHNVTVYANYTTGNMSSRTVWFTVHLTPYITLTSPGNTTYNTTSITISGTTDTSANITWSLDGDTNQSACNNCTSFSNTTTIQDGAHSVTIYAVYFEGATFSNSTTGTSQSTQHPPSLSTSP